jgi:prevent-host-death family protein
MSVTVNIHEAKTNLSRLLAQVEAGEEVIIARNGKPVAKIEPFTPPRIEYGFLDLGTISDDVFFEPMTEAELAEWE